MLLWIHIISWLVLLIATVMGLTRRSEKARNRYLILDRLAYLLLIVTGVYLATKTITHAPLLTLLKACLGIGSIGLIEIAFARQQESRLISWLAWGLLLILLVTSGVGVFLHYQLTGNFW